MTSQHPLLPMEPEGDVDHNHLARGLAVVDSRVGNVEGWQKWQAGVMVTLVLAVIAAAVQFGEMRGQIEGLQRVVEAHHAQRAEYHSEQQATAQR